MIATHDSLSGYSLKYWFLKPFNFMAKCQTKNLQQQFDEGSRSFDLRFAWCKNKWYAAHGIQLFKITLEQALTQLIELSKIEPIYFRILCEDTFYKKSDYKKLYVDTIKYLENHQSDKLKLLYIRSKKTWDGYSTKFEQETANFDSYPMMGNDRKDLCLRVSRMYELQTSNDKINFIGCYESSGIPRLFGLPYPKTAANALTPIVKSKKWKSNDCPVVDFI